MLMILKEQSLKDKELIFLSWILLFYDQFLFMSSNHVILKHLLLDN